MWSSQFLPCGICSKESRLKLKAISQILFLCTVFLFSWAFFFRTKNLVIFLDWFIIEMQTSVIRVGLVIDLKSIIFAATVILIRASILNYRLEYIKFEVYFYRFALILILFVLSMLVLIFSSNLIRILLGWDGLGISSYFLVVYYQRKNSLNAGLITGITNRLGDIGIIVLIRFFLIYGSWNFISPILTNVLLSVIFLRLVSLISFTKRAQIPFSAWLPAAIAAPTPVSSLVHSSTLVTAGIYLLIRFNVESSFLVSVGMLTSSMACLAALLEADFKKIIAFSTLSHLGFMVAIIGFNISDIAFFHLILHAFFKALLFIVVGAIIHSRNDYQSFIKISSSLNMVPTTSATLLCALMRLVGLPFLTGFFSKDIALESIFSINSSWFLVFAVFTTRLGRLTYSVRIFKIILLSRKQLTSIVWVLVGGGGGGYMRKTFPLLIAGISGGKFLKLTLFFVPNFIFFSHLIKTLIPILFIYLAGATWIIFTSKKYFFVPFLVHLFFIQVLSILLPPFLIKKTSSLVTREQQQWVTFHTSSVGNFWKFIFLKENFLRKNFFPIIKIIVIFIIIILLLYKY